VGPTTSIRLLELPIRTFAPPEIMLLELVRPDGPESERGKATNTRGSSGGAVARGVVHGPDQ